MSESHAADDAPSRLANALRTGGPEVPEALHVFDRIARASVPRPGFSEHSARYGDTLEPHRLTHYFDVRPNDAALVRDVGERFLRIAAALAQPVPGALAELLVERLPRRSEPMQVVLGIDARADAAATRSKYYVLFRQPAADLVRAIVAELAMPMLPGLEPAEVFLVGIDVDAGGVSDVKLYLRLDRGRLPRTTGNLHEVEALVRGARTVVLSQSLARTTRRQLHFHATDDRLYAAWLEGRAASSAAVAALLSHARGLSARIDRGRLAPWIVGVEHRDGRVDPSAGNVYFHLT